MGTGSSVLAQLSHDSVASLESTRRWNVQLFVGTSHERCVGHCAAAELR